MTFVAGFEAIDKTQIRFVGGKGANLGELAKIEGIRVPEGFCISTEAYKKVFGNIPAIDKLLDQLSLLKANDRDKIGKLSRDIRTAIEQTSIPHDIRDSIFRFLSAFGEADAYAVRSSATAEDLPTASFAGQQDTYLNIIGKTEILRHISKCWASLFTDRAVTYRIQNGFDHRKVQLSVVVQKMIFPQAAGIMFTADPVTSNRKVLSIDASFGLGEALVSGIVNADVYKVRDGDIIDKKISGKKVAIYASKSGGTREQTLEPNMQNRQALTDGQILELEKTGRKIEAHFGRPQDIEWCLADDTIYIVQSRPITTLFPIPENDGDNHVYISVGHQQMMTDAMRPLGLSFFLLTGKGSMFTAAGRLFVDIAKALSMPATRQNLVDLMGQSDPLLKDAIVTILERGDLIEAAPDDGKGVGLVKSGKGLSPAAIVAQVGTDPSVATDFIRSTQQALDETRQMIRSKSGVELFDFIVEDLQRAKTFLFDPKSVSVFMAAIHASLWLNESMLAWLDEKNVADTISQSVSGNVTSEMGLALMDVADVIRPYPEVIEYLQQTKADNFLDGLSAVSGGEKARTAIVAYLDKYGMRCAGEIDITRTRWSEKPATLIPVILGNIRNFETGAGGRRFEQGREEALNKVHDLLRRLEQLPDGDRKAADTKQMIDVVRNFIGYREYPKYLWVNFYFVYKQALMNEADHLVHAKIIREKEDVYFLTFDEFREVVRTGQLDYDLINRRKEEFRSYEKLTPPRVITSDGEIVTGKYKREDLPAGAIIGLPVSSGTVEGRARVILNMEDANLEEGDILITTFTDPSWTPLFVSIKGLVTEVGGLMTHGAVIAREYGLPAVVGVENATNLVKDGQRICVNGTDGYIKLLS